MKKIRIIHLVYLIGLINLIGSCTYMSTMQTARVTGKKQFGYGAGISVVHVPGIGALGNDLNENPHPDKYHITDDLMPSINGRLRYGIGKKSDMGLDIDAGTMSALCDFKYQFVGNDSSIFAASTGLVAGVNYVTIPVVTLPIYLSVHPTKNIAFYMAPKFTFTNSNSYVSSAIGTRIDLGQKYALFTEYNYGYGNLENNDPYQYFQSQFNIGLSWGIR